MATNFGMLFYVGLTFKTPPMWISKTRLDQPKVLQEFDIAIA